MRITVIVLLLTSSFAVSSKLVAADGKPADVAGNWDVTIRMPVGPVSEHWTIRQKGTVVTATAKTGHGELPVSGTIEGAFFRVTVKDGDKQYKVRATVDGADMDGSITLGVGDSHLWFAKRFTNGKKAGDR
jgi:hypothetical protein